jgi:hypothetical protein
MGWTFVMLTYVHLGKAFPPCHDMFFYNSGTFVVSTIFAMSAEREVGAFIMYTYTVMTVISTCKTPTPQSFALIFAPSPLVKYP